MKRKAIFLDRDGVLNDAILLAGKPYPPANLAQVTIPRDAKLALLRLKAKNYLLIGATNQPDVARGITPKKTVLAINAFLLSQLPLTTMMVCYHDDQDHCLCRKPVPGLLLAAALRYNIDLNRSIMIGDRYQDVVAGQRAGCETILLTREYNTQHTSVTPSYRAKSLLDCVAWIATIN